MGCHQALLEWFSFVDVKNILFVVCQYQLLLLFEYHFLFREVELHDLAFLKLAFRVLLGRLLLKVFAYLLVLNRYLNK